MSSFRRLLVIDVVHIIQWLLFDRIHDSLCDYLFLLLCLRLDIKAFCLGQIEYMIPLIRWIRAASSHHCDHLFMVSLLLGSFETARVLGFAVLADRLDTSLRDDVRIAWIRSECRVRETWYCRNCTLT